MSNMLRNALLSGAALAVMTTGAAADELNTLKAQLAALQSQVDTIQTASAQAPAGSSFLRYERGLGGNTWGLDAVKDSANVNDGSGFTIAVTPTADLPAPVAEVTVYGYVAGHVAYDFDENHGVANSFRLKHSRRRLRRSHRHHRQTVAFRHQVEDRYFCGPDSHTDRR